MEACRDVEVVAVGDPPLGARRVPLRAGAARTKLVVRDRPGARDLRADYLVESALPRVPDAA